MSQRRGDIGPGPVLQLGCSVGGSWRLWAVPTDLQRVWRSCQTRESEL